MFRLILSCKQIDRMILGKMEILEGDWSREGVLSDRNILVWSCRVVVTAFQSLDSITQWNNLIWTWCLLNFKQLLADKLKGVVTWKLTIVLHNGKSNIYFQKDHTQSSRSWAKLNSLEKRRSFGSKNQVKWRTECIRSFHG